MMKTAFVVACAGLAFAASADVLTGSAFGPSLDRGPRVDLAEGSAVHTGNGVFNSAGGAVLNEADPHLIGSTTTMVNALGRPDQIVTSAVATAGDLRTITITWGDNAGNALIRTGDAVGGAAITTLSFELGSANFPNGGIFDPQFLGFNHPEDPTTPGTFLGTFDLFDTSSGTIFSGDFFLMYDAVTSQISGRTFISAGGSDLAGFNIMSGTATFSYFVVPTPSSAALLGVAGLAAARRRR